MENVVSYHDMYVTVWSLIKTYVEFQEQVLIY